MNCQLTICFSAVAKRNSFATPFFCFLITLCAHNEQRRVGRITFNNDLTENYIPESISRYIFVSRSDHRVLIDFSRLLSLRLMCRSRLRSLSQDFTLQMRFP